MNLLITGATGFVGNHFVRFLADQDLRIWGTAPNDLEKMDADVADRVSLLICDLRDREQVSRVLVSCQPDYILHLAAQSNVPRSWDKPIETFETNIIGTLNLLEETIKLGLKPKTLLIGSAEEYGKVLPEQQPINEMQPLNPVTPYGASKVAISIIFRQYYLKYGLPVLLARPFTHIGPGQAPGFVTVDFAKQIAEIEQGLREPVMTVGNLEAQRDFTSVKDIVGAYWALMNKGLPGETYNVASGQAIAIQEILDTLIRKTYFAIEVRRDEAKMRPSDVPAMSGDISKIKRDTGWSPAVPVESCLEDILNYWRAVCIGG